MTNVLVFPQNENPYQKLLYSEVTKHNIHIAYLRLASSSHIISLLLLFPQILIYRIKGYTIFHLHWLYDFHLQVNTPFYDNALTRLFFTFYACLFIIWIRICGYRLVYTLHNIVPHKQLFISDLFITRFICFFSHKKIIHSQSTLEEMKEKHISTTHTTIIPIGMYTQYPNTIPQSKARQRLAIAQNAFVFLFIGKIEPYKGLLDLLQSFTELCKKVNTNNLFLLVGGEVHDENLKRAINQYKGTPNISLHLMFIPNADIQLYLNSADIIVCPYKKVTTSSVASLALAFNKPLIFPKLGNLRDFPDTIGYSYVSTDNLETVLEKAYVNKEKLQFFVKQINVFRRKFSWQEAGEKTAALFK